LVRQLHSEHCKSLHGDHEHEPDGGRNIQLMYWIAVIVGLGPGPDLG
jgi:hypothetical protein